VRLGNLSGYGSGPGLSVARLSLPESLVRAVSSSALRPGVTDVTLERQSPDPVAASPDRSLGETVHRPGDPCSVESLVRAHDPDPECPRDRQNLAPSGPPDCGHLLVDRPRTLSVPWEVLEVDLYSD